MHKKSVALCDKIGSREAVNVVRRFHKCYNKLTQLNYIETFYTISVLAARPWTNFWDPVGRDHQGISPNNEGIFIVCIFIILWRAPVGLLPTLSQLWWGCGADEPPSRNSDLDLLVVAVVCVPAPCRNSSTLSLSLLRNEKRRRLFGRGT